MQFTKLREWSVFGGEYLRRPAKIGAVAPSSRALARRMASFLPEEAGGLVLEIGAGTGAITRAILDQGVPVEQLVSVERSSGMADYLRKRFPDVRIVQGDAAQLRTLWPMDLKGVPVRCVVSSLPLMALPSGAASAISREMRAILSPGGRLIQYTYHLSNSLEEILTGFDRVASSLVWRNLPPARVNVYQPAPNGHPTDMETAAGQAP